ncbi:MAG: hypothetical protein HC905_16780 [Bacteroidales bacterium]|nr:hypothetical protein [Bacteroidales bacterium]
MRQLYLTFCLSCFIFCISVQSYCQTDEAENNNKKITYFREDNAACLKCHSSYHYNFPNSDSSKIIRKELCDNYVIDTMLFYSSNHKTFKCIDCHSESYAKYPHDANLKAEEGWTCMDCHAGDEAYAKYHL